jgi:hypothetical protein
MSSYEVFLEKIAELLASTLTDQETQYVLSGVRMFADRIKHHSTPTPTFPTKTPFCLHEASCRQNAIRGFLRTFSAAFGVKYLVGLVQALLTGRSPLLSALQDGLSWDTLRFSGFFALFIGGYKAINCTMRHVRDKEDWRNSCVAGSISSLAILLDERHRRTAIALYLSSRALQAGWSAMERRDIVPIVPYGETALMGLCNLQIIYAYLLEPDTLAPSYYKVPFTYLLNHLLCVCVSGSMIWRI